MLQIRNSIILKLNSKNNHIRGLAKEIAINQTSIFRIAKKLEKENIVDYRIEGRNKVYFLKDSTEAKENIIISEHYKLIELISKYPILRNIVEKIKLNKKIKLSLFFGSYSKFNPRKNSDIDIFIETKDENIKKEIEKINSKINVKIGYLDKENLLSKEIFENHVIIKGVDKFYEYIY